MKLPEQVRQYWLGTAFVVFSAIGFAAKAIFVKLAYQYGVTAMPLLTLRMLFALPFFVLMWWFSPKPVVPPSSHTMSLVVVAGLIGYYASSALDFYGLQYISASLERLILFLYPTFTVLLGVVCMKERLHGKMVLALLVSYMGIATVFLPDLWGSHAGQQAHLWLGTSLVFASTLSYAVYLVLSGRLIQQFGSQRFVATAMLVSAFGVLVHSALVGALTGITSLPLPVYAYAAVMAIFSTVMPSWLLAEGVKRVGASQAALVSTLGPAMTLLMGCVILGEQLQALQWLGGAVVIAGVMWMSQVKRRQL